MNYAVAMWLGFFFPSVPMLDITWTGAGMGLNLTLHFKFQALKLLIIIRRKTKDGENGTFIS